MQSAERRARMVPLDEVEDIASRSAQKALSDLFEIFGVDIQTTEGRKGMQDDMSFVREARIGVSNLKKAGWGAAAASLVTGITYACWKGLAALAAIAAK